MQNLEELRENYDKNTIKTIASSKQNYDKLKKFGFAGESFNTVVGRLLEKLGSLK
jgi:predicted CopG family antitoxin